MMKNKKGHFDLETLVISVFGGIIAYIFARKHLLKYLSKDKVESKNEKNMRIR